MKNIEKIKEYYISGTSLTQIAKIIGVSRWLITRRLKSIGVKIVNKHNLLKFNECYFDSIDSEEKAYWLGFIYADGCILKNCKSFELGLSIKDKSHVELFASNVSFTGKLYFKKNVNAITCNLRSKHFWETLNNYGCVPNKSLILKFPKECIFKDQSLIRHFIRGYFDGDGCISQHVNVKSVTPCVTILGTKDFLNKIIKYTKIPAKFRRDKRHSSEVYSLNYSKENSIKLINYLYNNSTISLERKYNKYIFFKNGSRSVQEWAEWLEGKIGESPKQDNPEVNN